MEPVSRQKGHASVVVVEMPVDWTDVGSWPALAEILPVDEHNNALSCKTGLFLDSDDNVIFSQDPAHLISTIGVSDMIIVHAPDATLICPKDQAQRVKELVGKVKDKFGDKFQ
jgi:mannose-1-phosphate guanylyltransferase